MQFRLIDRWARDLVQIPYTLSHLKKKHTTRVDYFLGSQMVSKCVMTSYFDAGTKVPFFCALANKEDTLYLVPWLHDMWSCDAYPLEIRNC